MLLQKQLIDLSHTVEHGLITYNGLPAPVICDYWSREHLLGAEIPMVEHLCHLDLLPDASFRFSAVPVKVKGFGTFPVRAFAVVER